MQLKNQVAIVTGGGSGLGRAMALGLAREGVKVLIAEVREPEGRFDPLGQPGISLLGISARRRLPKNSSNSASNE